VEKQKKISLFFTSEEIGKTLTKGHEKGETGWTRLFISRALGFFRCHGEATDWHSGLHAGEEVEKEAPDRPPGLFISIPLQ
jgi:hypothetical protein